MNPLLSRRVVLAKRPEGPIQHHDFKFVSTTITDVPDDHVVLKVIYIQIAPAARAVMTSTTGFDQTNVGDGILCAVVGDVVVTCAGGPALGSSVMSYGFWEEYSVVPMAQALPVVAGHPLIHNLGVLGLNGLTAYYGMIRIGGPQPGETVVISAAAGGVGHLAGQIAHHAGARVVGITGSDDKNRRLENEFNFTHTVNHRHPNFHEDLRAACGPSGVAVYFDNIAGDVLTSMLPLMRPHGRIVCCGATAQYDQKDDNLVQPGPRGIPQYLINKSLRLEGFLTADYAHEWAQGRNQLSDWLTDGTIRSATQTWHGLESAPDALLAVLAGENFGQAVVQLPHSGPSGITL
ncbi:NADP-dependent oxidoreductase [Mycobacterium sp. Aquia_216]|uniref:MDR family NADP-dependent oxidoreductase n=1 Tax=Mycobacterium sp. Aquia_216 TaxID=2991729 RepID=UPI00227BDFCD|nr:NADP-dependent oxidoreductase [Mycobacterium sp. Aquia_216]WAJ45309.1 NADP-dependent oxidoreductase [Mycobacterium sp. Aquia_216]